MAEVEVLMAAYNGEKFIAEQIDSIIAQTFKDFRILIRDDGSTDGTLKIIERYEKKYPEFIKIIHDNEICRNPTNNFFQIMKHASADYVMFSDQDDYWQPYKIQIMLNSIKEAEQKNPGKPVLIFSEWEDTDENLNKLNKIFTWVKERKQYENFTSLITNNCAAGCNMIINREVYKKIGSYEPCIKFHDYWLALFACSCGVIQYLQMALILHRNHNDNFTAVKEPHTLRDILIMPVKKFKSSKKTFNSLKEEYSLFKERYSQYMLPEKLKELENYLLLFDGNIFERFTAFIKINRAVNFSMKEKILWIMRIILF